MLKALAALMEFAFPDGAGRHRPQDDSWDAAFAEARRRFPADRLMMEADALAELQRRTVQGERRHDA